MPTLDGGVCPVTANPAADSAAAIEHFERSFQFETDCWDVHAGLEKKSPHFVVLDVRSPDAYAKGHVPGAMNLPHGRINERNLEPFGKDVTFVVYCNGPHCNGADRGALRLAKLGRKVKKMIGGVTGWLDEGFSLTT
jgi:rhodanese-related sulfurtransferase